MILTSENHLVEGVSRNGSPATTPAQEEKKMITVIKFINGKKITFFVDPAEMEQQNQTETPTPTKKVQNGTSQSKIELPDNLKEIMKSPNARQGGARKRCSNPGTPKTPRTQMPKRSSMSQMPDIVMDIAAAESIKVCGGLRRKKKCSTMETIATPTKPKQKRSSKWKLELPENFADIIKSPNVVGGSRARKRYSDCGMTNIPDIDMKSPKDGKDEPLIRRHSDCGLSNMSDLEKKRKGHDKPAPKRSSKWKYELPENFADIIKSPNARGGARKRYSDCGITSISDISMKGPNAADDNTLDHEKYAKSCAETNTSKKPEGVTKEWWPKKIIQSPTDLKKAKDEDEVDEAKKKRMKEIEGKLTKIENDKKTELKRMKEDFEVEKEKLKHITEAKIERKYQPQPMESVESMIVRLQRENQSLLDEVMMIHHDMAVAKKETTLLESNKELLENQFESLSSWVSQKTNCKEKKEALEMECINHIIPHQTVQLVASSQHCRVECIIKNIFEKTVNRVVDAVEDRSIDTAITSEVLDLLMDCQKEVEEMSIVEPPTDFKDWLL